MRGIKSIEFVFENVTSLTIDAKYFDDIEQALIASVNHTGDSDSTGAVLGNILGAAVGYDALPQHFKDDLEMHDVILKVADQLFEYEN